MFGIASRKWFNFIVSITLWQHFMIKPTHQRSFGIDYDGGTFVKDGQPFRYISGSMHYARVPRPSWQDRLQKIRSTGVNTVQTYVPWNYHERTIRTYSNLGDLNDFIALVNQTGLLIIMRPGPYICAEWDMGGLPAWLLKTPSIRLRSSDADYVAAVDRWMAVLLPMIYPWLYQNGGPIIAVQVENEYGSYGCDAQYLRHLFHLFRLHLGNDVLLFTSDEPKLKSLQCGSLQGLYSTINFGPDTNATEAFLLLRKIESKGPLVNSEFYTGWLDYWGHKHSTKASSLIAHALDRILSTGASVNMYMFEGGTNFGYWSGADYKTAFLPVTTSYDYDAPLSEAGDPTDKLFAIRDVIRKYIDEPMDPMPSPGLKYPYGFVPMRLYKEVIELLPFLAPYPPVKSKFPIDFEQMKQSHGFLLYQTSLPKAFDVHTPLKSAGIHDRAYVTINGTFQGVLERDGVSTVNVCGPKGARLDLLVENMGRIGFGHQIHEHKGIVSNVTIGGEILTPWLITSLDMEVPLPELHDTDRDVDRKAFPHSTGPAFYMGSFTLPKSIFFSPRDTFLRLQGWTKGFVWINGDNLGRYWSRGPQQTLYVPGSFLSRFLPNNVTVLELEHSPCSSGGTRCLVRFIDQPILEVASESLWNQPSLPGIP
uniref:beta-galactosidase-like isoform X1 n=1 Tax=Myxine glutinosa TaxID=7769 RepID=UPI00358E8D3E